ncbi:MAG: DUF4153 domain-containing protein [Candidatus Binatia bacterium]
METPTFVVSERARLGFGVVMGALILGVLGDGLLRTTPWGVNVPIWIVALGAVVIWLVRWQHIVLEGQGRWLACLVPVFAMVFAWRDSLTLQLLNGGGLITVLALSVLRFRSGRLREMHVSAYAAGTTHVVGQAFTGSAQLFSEDIRWHEIPRHQWGPPARAIGQGLLLSVPLVFLFGSLLASADAAFEQMTTSFFEWLFSNFFIHLTVIGGVAWLVGGILRQALLSSEWHPFTTSVQKTWSLGIIELGVVLGLLNALFFAFVVVQIRYFFGGLETVATSPGLTVAEYARRGFFELVMVAALVLPLLLLAHSLLRTDNTRDEQPFSILAGALVLQLFVIMASALQRMWLYQSLYGLTELRLYTTVFMLWLAVVFVWFLLTVLREHRERFAFGVLLCGCSTILLLNALNPDALIVRTNLSRDDAATTLDARYVTSLSADAVPTLIATLPALDDSKRRAVVARLVVRWSAPTTSDWRTWNWSRWQARKYAMKLSVSTSPEAFCAFNCRNATAR